jgi:hypothetical protein
MDAVSLSYDFPGTETAPDESVYEGEFVLGQKEGQGVIRWKDGAKYEGNFVANQLEGRGMSRLVMHRHLYVGQWSQVRRRMEGQQNARARPLRLRRWKGI